jgi:hypothetical protein
MTRIVFLTALTALVGCKKDECDDTAAGACDTGAVEVEEEEEPTNAVPTGDSCSWGATVCVSAGEPDNEGWCTGLSGTYSADACATGYDGSCAIPAGGDYTAAATAYYYSNSDAEGACEGASGVYTPAI